MERNRTVFSLLVGLAVSSGVVGYIETGVSRNKRKKYSKKRVEVFRNRDLGEVGNLVFKLTQYANLVPSVSATAIYLLSGFSKHLSLVPKAKSPIIS